VTDFDSDGNLSLFKGWIERRSLPLVIFQYPGDKGARLLVELLKSKATHRSFLDRNLAEQFEREGYVVIPLLSESDIARVEKIYNDRKPSFNTGWHTDMFSDDFEYRRITHELVGGIFAERLLPLLDDYRYCCGNFVVKESSPTSTVPLHQDWTIIDPTATRSLNVVCPLIETNAENGQLFVVPGSHHEPCRISYGPSDELLIEPLLPLIREKYLKRLNQKPGEALIYDGRVLHGSDANLSGSARVCFSAAFAPNESMLRHYFRDPSDPETLEVYEVPAEFFWKHRLGKRPDEGILLGKIHAENLPITETHLSKWNQGLQN